MTHKILNKQSFKAEGRWQQVCAHPDCPKRGNPDWQSHHVIYAQHIRAIDAEREWDPRDALRLCSHCHARHHNRQAPVPLSALVDDNIEFAVELMGATAAHEYLTRYYSGRDPRVDALVEAA